jgi:hypothetical protein
MWVWGGRKFAGHPAVIKEIAMGASGMNAKKKQKRRRHAETRKKRAERMASVESRPATPRRAPKSSG